MEGNPRFSQYFFLFLKGMQSFDLQKFINNNVKNYSIYYLKFFICLLVVMTFNTTSAQPHNIPIIKGYLQENLNAYSLKLDDISNLSISSQTFSESLQVENVYVIQKFKGIKIFNSNSSFSVRNEKVVSSALSFSNNIAENLNTISPALSPEIAITNVVSDLGLGIPINLNLLETPTQHSFIFSEGGVSLKNIPVELVFYSLKNEKLRLAWDLSIKTLDEKHYFSVRVDAITGALLDVVDWVINCAFEEKETSIFKDEVSFEKLFFKNESERKSSLFGPTPKYRVLALPVVSPIDGDETLIIDPADPIASPDGWHNTDGQHEVPEYTITRGNNVLAKTSNAGGAEGYSPDGTAALLFDFPFIQHTMPMRIKDASLTQLFYMNNMMHDVWYQYGFDEQSGNFQVNNYGKGGDGDDPVYAHGMDGLVNNAMFIATPDGEPSDMYMYLWDSSEEPGNPVIVNDGNLAGEYGGAITRFGGMLPLEGTLTSDLAVLKGEGGEDYSGCGTIVNGGEIAGKIAIVGASGCYMGLKIKKAETEGAIAVIVVNYTASPPEPIDLGNWVSSVNIPSILMEKDIGELLMNSVINGEKISVSLQEVPPYPLDGDLDNIVIAHEYGHGISSRLTGGRTTVGCLANDENIGEGWSDWFGLVMTIKEGDDGTESRGVGTYVKEQPLTGNGVRTYPYSTDMNINPETYDDIKTSAIPHGVGAVGAGMLWEMTWKLIETYGFDPDLTNGTGGNNIAMQLVIDGLKLQRCAPGFIDTRNAILEADELANEGANKCLIWEAFAKRGLGFSADQGSRFDATDGIEAFDLPPECSLGIGDSKSSLKTFIIYPNPSNGKVTIKTSNEIGQVNISIIDMNGRSVFSQEVDLRSSSSIDASKLNKGIYIIKIEDKSHHYRSKLILY